MVRPGPCISLLCMTWRIVSSVTMSSLPVTFWGGMVDKQGISGRRGFRRQPFPPFSTAPPPSSPLSGQPKRSHYHPGDSPENFRKSLRPVSKPFLKVITSWSRLCTAQDFVFWWCWCGGCGLLGWKLFDRGRIRCFPLLIPSSSG